MIATSGCGAVSSGPGTVSPDVERAENDALVSADTVRVAAPTGQPGTDVASVQDVFDRVRPGDTVLFAPGTYVLGEGARLTTPDVTVLGHPEGTVIRGCDPERFVMPPGFDMEDVEEVVFGCTGLFVLADRQTIRGLTFDHTWHGLVVGHLQGPPGSGAIRPGFGGHRIEENIFRHVPNGIRVVGPTDAVTVIRDNQVVNAYHAFQSNGAPVHVIDNRISVPDPGSVPAAYYPESGVILSTGPAPGSCNGSLVAGNVIEGTVHGIQVLAGPGEHSCADHEIRDNIVRLRPVPLPAGYPPHLRDFYFAEGAEGSMVAGIGIRLYGRGYDADPAAGPAIRDVLIQNNRISGATGLGIQLVAATGTRIIENHISDIGPRAPFPGLTWGDAPERWRGANGSGIWLSPGSNGNEIVGNTFEDIASHPVFLEGDSNHVALRSDAEAVRDLGTGNRVTAPTTISSGTAEQRSIAVLPFADISPAGDQEYFADGFSEELWEIFGHLPELRVAYRNSAFAFKGKDVGLDSIGRALNVGHLLKGGVSREGEHVRITAQLIDASTGDHVWSGTYEREMKDLFQIENEIARAVVNQIQLELGGGRAGVVLAREETKDPEAHLLLLRGRRLLRQFTPEGVEQAEPLLKQAIARDPAYARAHAELAAVYRNQVEQGLGPVETLMGQARAAVERALELDPRLARAHYQKGWIAYRSGDRFAAEANFARAGELNPGYAPAHSMRAYLLAILGRPEEAIRAAEWTTALDPASPARQADVAAVFLYARQYERAAEAYQSALVLDSDRPSTWGDLAFVYALMGRHAEVVRAAEQARALAPKEQWPLTALGYAYARAGRHAEAKRVLHTLENLPEPDPYLRAMLNAGLGEGGNVFPLLSRP